MEDVQRESEWFRGDAPRGERSRRFVVALSSAAAQWGFDDLEGSATSSTPAEPGTGVEEVRADVRLPGLTAARHCLTVHYDPDVRGLPVLTSRWSTGEHAPDDCDDAWEPPDEEADLWVSGVEVTPEQCGTWAAAWFERQLRRPVCRREWDAPTTGWSTLLPRRRPDSPALVEWTVEEPDSVLDVRGEILWDWLRRREPSREVWERPRPVSPGSS